MVYTECFGGEFGDFMRNLSFKINIFLAKGIILQFSFSYFYFKFCFGIP